MLKNIGIIIGLLIVLFMIIWNTSGKELFKYFMKLVIGLCIYSYYFLTFVVIISITYATKGHIKGYQDNFVPYTALLFIITFLFTTNRDRLGKIFKVVKNKIRENSLNENDSDDKIDWLEKNYNIIYETLRDNKWLLLEFFLTILIFIILHIGWVTLNWTEKIS